jgi:hypothetical protein
VHMKSWTTSEPSMAPFPPNSTFISSCSTTARARRPQCVLGFARSGVACIAMVFHAASR